MRWPGIESRQRFVLLKAGWRRLGRFWLGILLVLTAGAVTLQILGPPIPPGTRPVASKPPPSQLPASGQRAVQPASPPRQTAEALPVGRPGRDTPGPIADPDPALLEPLAGTSSDLLPRIAMDGRLPMQVYAAGFDSSTRRPRVGLLIAGVGLNQADSQASVRALPGGVTFAISPYAQNLAKLLPGARLAEHEYLVSIPLEPQRYPPNDSGPQPLMTNLGSEQNLARLQWALSRIAGYVGATAALGSLRGERFASLPDQINPVLVELTKRGLLYIDPRPGTPPLPLVWSRTVDLVIDEPPTAANIDDKLARLARLARGRGSALGLATVVRPVTTERIAAWANGLAADGLALAPVSALVQPPAGGPAQ
jgi:polysaccharide deacetylase 2 family uncharacterized protein YibQ